MISASRAKQGNLQAKDPHALKYRNGVFGLVLASLFLYKELFPRLSTLTVVPINATTGRPELGAGSNDSAG
jgi:hypothetical protein